MSKLTKKLLKDYNADKPTSYIIYLEATNLYGHSMMRLSRWSSFSGWRIKVAEDMLCEYNLKVIEDKNFYLA